MSSVESIAPRVVRIAPIGRDEPPLRVVVDEIRDGELLVPLEQVPEWVSTGVRVEVTCAEQPAPTTDASAAVRFQSSIAGFAALGDRVAARLVLPSHTRPLRGAEKRRAARAHVHKQATASLLDAGRHPGRLIEARVSNLSATGMLLGCENPLPAGSHLVASLEVAGHRVKVLGTVIEGSCESGAVRVDFDSLDDEALAAIAVEVANLTGARSPYETSPQLASLRIPRAVRQAYAMAAACKSR